jgi:hypothetical protein
MKDGAVDVGLGQEARVRRAGGERKCLVVGSGGKGRAVRVWRHTTFSHPVKSTSVCTIHIGTIR